MEWINVKDKLPKPETKVLVLIKNNFGTTIGIVVINNVERPNIVIMTDGIAKSRVVKGE